MFTVEQYDQAIEALQAARQQTIDGNYSDGCGVCGDSCNPHSCRFNPLYAMHMCDQIGKQSDELHSTLHMLAGFDIRMGEMVGPAAIVVPPKKPTEFIDPDDCELAGN